jgi:hypothetical protein
MRSRTLVMPFPASAVHPRKYREHRVGTCCGNEVLGVSNRHLVRMTRLLSLWSASARPLPMPELPPVMKAVLECVLIRGSPAEVKPWKDWIAWLQSTYLLCQCLKMKRHTGAVGHEPRSNLVRSPRWRRHGVLLRAFHPAYPTGTERFRP